MFSIFYFAPSGFRALLGPYEGCIGPDVDKDGEPYGFHHFLDKQPGEKACDVWLIPEGKKAPASMFAIWWLIVIGPVLSIPVNLVYWFLYRNEFPWIEQYRIYKEKPWPWKIDPEGWRIKIYWGIFYMLINTTITNYVTYVVYGYFYNYQLTYIDHRVDTIPTSWTMFKHIIFCTICDDFFFYWIHRFLHIKHKNFPIY